MAKKLEGELGQTKAQKLGIIATEDLKKVWNAQRPADPRPQLPKLGMEEQGKESAVTQFPKNQQWPPFLITKWAVHRT